ncbi:TetR family transcriptional regulator [Streptomyces sp. RY43-2]|uniref:TetR family transcriptional regulator n=1 Tax=Streptomyces macrolidinus TaxID=2952607 RepID=A0ABT0Z909_9ACTN|nr:TetR family transcriptional regulator [Streptomyces macrolidinus]MCN9240246.1 TetR family transcriptional regulator [Streptomyces macrolidinus]
MSHPLGVRQAQKQKTRQAFLDAALVLLEEQSLSSLGLREVTRAVGVAPTAFYRHFPSIADLGVELVKEALDSLHPLIGSTASAEGDRAERCARAVDLIAGHVEAYPAHVRFIAREWHGGVQPVREAIRRQLARFAEEVKVALAQHPESEGWSDEDLLMLAGLYVDQMLMTASQFLVALESSPEERDRVVRVTTQRLLLIDIGRDHWND